jgi:hypothetical protein
MVVWNKDEDGDSYKAAGAFVIRNKRQNDLGNWQYQRDKTSGEKHNGDEWFPESLLSSR